MDWSGCEFVERVDGRRSGQPTVRGTRVPPETFLEWTQDGFSVEEMQRNFPSVSVEQIQGVLKFAHREQTAA